MLVMNDRVCLNIFLTISLNILLSSTVGIVGFRVSSPPDCYSPEWCSWLSKYTDGGMWYYSYLRYCNVLCNG
jgi:hypothetical protein